MERGSILRRPGLFAAWFALLLWLSLAAQLAAHAGDSKIIGDNTMVPIKADGSNIDPKLRPYLDAVGIITVGSAGACTATHIGNGYVITAGHCFFDETFVGTRVVQNKTCDNMKVFWGYRGSPATQNPKPLVSLQSQCTQVIYAEQTQQRDFAIFRVDVAPKVSIRIANERSRTRQGTKLTMLGYPQGRPLEWSQYCSLETASSARLSASKGQSTFAHTCDTEAGSSGSAVLAFSPKGEPLVVGIHDGAASLGIEYNYATYLYDARMILKNSGFDLAHAATNVAFAAQ